MIVAQVYVKRQDIHFYEIKITKLGKTKAKGIRGKIVEQVQSKGTQLANFTLSRAGRGPLHLGYNVSDRLHAFDITG